MSERSTRIMSAPSFIVDPQSITRFDGRQIDWTAITAENQVTPGGIVTTTGAAAAATSIPIAASPVAIKAGTTLDWTGAGEFSLVTADVAVGATSIPVEALDVAIENGDTAIVPGSGGKYLRAGTAMAVVNPGTNNKLQKRDASHTAVGLLASDAYELDRAASLTGYGLISGGNIYEALLPDSTGTPRTLLAAIKTELAAAPTSTGFGWHPYTDDSTT